MPPLHFSRQKELQNTVTVALLRGVRNVVSGISENSFGQFSSIHRSNIGRCRHYSEISGSISRETIDQRKSLSFIGSFTRIVLFSPASSISCQFYHYHSKNSRLEMNRISFHSTFEEKLMAPSSSLSQIAIRKVRCPTLNKLRQHKFPVPAFVTVKTFTNCHGRVSGSLKDRHSYGNNMLYRFFWSNTFGMSSHSNPSLEVGIENCHSSASSCSSGTPSDGLLDGSDTQEQPDSSMALSDWNFPGERKLKLLSGSCYLPHPDKEETGGEDAHFICVDEQAIGVADGVGGWADLGVDAGQYARELMFHSVAAIEQEPRGSIDPSRVLEKAYICTKAKGSSTACIIALTDQGKEEKLYKGIHAVNLGDSGFIVIRDGCTVFRSPVQQHDFNFTYQLECGQGSDLPSSAQVFAFPVASGDVIVTGTDGLFDNLYSNEIAKVVVQAVRAGLGPQVTAQKIAALARQWALDNSRQTPFSAAAQDAGYRYYGGKLDDVTVVVSYITVSED